MRTAFQAASRRAILVCLAMFGLAGSRAPFGPGPLAAQGTGTLLVTVRRPDSTALAGAFVRSERVAVVADSAGVARLELPARLVSVRISHPGFRPRIFQITILPGVTQRYELLLEARDGSAAAATVAINGAGRAVDAEPMPVTILGRDDVTARFLAHPADFGQVFVGVPGLRSQVSNGPLGATRFRADGLRGQYTGLLVDGLPLLGGYPGAFAPMQLSPLEFDQVEWVRGPAVALLGPSAPGGVINLVSRRPDRDQVRFGVNQNSEKGGDLSIWAARRRSPTVSGTLFADFHQQRLVDSDDDGWGELPRAIRFAIRPRLYLDRPNGDGLTATVGVTSEDRTGGFLLVNTPGGDPYREERRTRRFDGGLSARRMVGSAGNIQVKVATVFQSISHRFDDLRERDHRSTIFGEARWRNVFGKATVSAGLAYQRDVLRQTDFPAFDYTHSVPSAFGSVTLLASSRVTAVVAGRCDAHNVHGTQCEPRADLLVRASERVDARVFGAFGYTAPTPLADEAEPLGFHGTVPVAAKAERLAATGVDLLWHSELARVRGALTFSRVGLPVRLVPFVGDTGNRLRLLNVAQPTRVFAVDLSADYRAEPFVLGASYAYRHGSEGVPGETGRRPVELTPGHQVGLSIGWRAPRATGTTVDVDLSVVGSQTVADNIFRTRTPTYGLVNGLVSQRSGKARLYVSGENLFDVKLRNYDPVFFDPIVGGRRTNAPWTTLRGRVINLGALVDW